MMNVSKIDFKPPTARPEPPVPQARPKPRLHQNRPTNAANRLKRQKPKIGVAANPK